jgi:hypothetical protein
VSQFIAKQWKQYYAIQSIESCVSHMIDHSNQNSTIWQSNLILQCQIRYTKKRFLKQFFVIFRFWNKFCMNLCLSFFFDWFEIGVWVFGIHSNPIKPWSPCRHQKLVRKTFWMPITQVPPPPPPTVNQNVTFPVLVKYLCVCHPPNLTFGQLLSQNHVTVPVLQPYYNILVSLFCLPCRRGWSGMGLTWWGHKTVISVVVYHQQWQ